MACCFRSWWESPALLTNGSGVFSQSLGEFVLASALFFAKDFRRMIRNQEAGVWAPFDVEEVSGQTMGIVGYGDIGRACARRAHAMGMKASALRAPAGAVGKRSAGGPRFFRPSRRLEMLVPDATTLPRRRPADVRPRGA